MNTLKTISILIILALIFGCKKNNDPQPDNRKTYLVKLTNANGVTTFDYNADNRLVSIIFTAIDGSITRQDYSGFNAAGLPARSTIVQAGETTTKDLEYDGQNRLAKITVREAGVLYKTTEYSYTANTMEYSNYSSSGSLWGRYVYSFDTKGNVSGYDVYNSSNIRTDQITCTIYDDKKSLKEFYYHEDTRPFTSFSNNNIAEMESVSGTAETVTQSYIHEYNNDGYPTKRILKIMPSGFETTVTYEYTKR